MIRARAHQAALLIDVAKRLGPEWVTFRLRYAAEQRLKVHQRRSPIAAWPSLAKTKPMMRNVVNADVLQEWLLGNVDDERRARLEQRVGSLRDRTFNVFGFEAAMESWHHDPKAGVHYPATPHWIEVKAPATADIKRIWEPSRFTWAFDLARAELIDPSLGAGELFWELFDEWSLQNQPNAGVNWGCGQEASFRLMSCICAAQAMPDLLTDARVAKLERLALVTASRVETNIAYARSQRNNHHASEAVGLLTAAMVFPDLDRASGWKDLGLKHLTEVAELLILADGGSSQYSTNYHRVFLHELLWAMRLFDIAESKLPQPIVKATERATNYLEAIVEPISGKAPFMGPDDGARVLPLSDTPHRYVRSDLDLANSLLGRKSACLDSNDTEPAAWFGRHRDVIPVYAANAHAAPWSVSFPNMGTHILGAGPWRVYVRCGNTTFRPSQEDQLHCDVWFGSENVAMDAGTQSYHPTEDEPGALDTASDHNTITLNNSGHMDRVGKFLWANWPVAKAFSSCDQNMAEGTFELAIHDEVVTRVVTVSAQSVSIEDFAISQPIQTRWLLSSTTLPSGTALKAATDVRLASDGYGRFHRLTGVSLQGSEGVSSVFTQSIGANASIILSATFDADA